MREIDNLDYWSLHNKSGGKTEVSKDYSTEQLRLIATRTERDNEQIIAD